MTIHDSTRRYDFASDNCSGICPAAWQAIETANRETVASYGEDPWTRQASDAIRELFEIDCDVFFTFNGTATNSLALASLCQSYHSVLLHQNAHAETDECGAPEFFSNGTKMLLIPGPLGKIDLVAVEETVRRRSDIHWPKPRVLSITQATEFGTVYSVAELGAIRETTRKLGLNLHMDGARFANAVASLGVAPKEISWKVGVDVLSFGGTKNGMAIGECIIFFRRELAEEFDYRCKQSGQLASKMRFLSAPWVGMLESGVWLQNAQHANRSAQRLAEALRAIDTVEIACPVEANSVFAHFPLHLAKGLRDAGWEFYDFIGASGSRLMCSWATTNDDIEQFVGDVKRLATSP